MSIHELLMSPRALPIQFLVCSHPERVFEESNPKSLPGFLALH